MINVIDIDQITNNVSMFIVTFDIFTVDSPLEWIVDDFTLVVGLVVYLGLRSLVLHLSTVKKLKCFELW